MTRFKNPLLLQIWVFMSHLPFNNIYKYLPALLIVKTTNFGESHVMALQEMYKFIVQSGDYYTSNTTLNFCKQHAAFIKSTKTYCFNSRFGDFKKSCNMLHAIHYSLIGKIVARNTLFSSFCCLQAKHYYQHVKQDSRAGNTCNNVYATF